MTTREQIEANIEVKTNADKFWKTFRDYSTIFLKVFPKYKSIEVLEGDGKSVGSVLRHITYTDQGKNFLPLNAGEELFSLTFCPVSGNQILVL